MMKAITFLLAMLLGLTGTAGNAERNYQKEISRIDVYHSGFGARDLEFLVDLENKMLFEFRMGSEYAVRDETDENEGFSFVRNLDDEDIAVFARESARFGLTKWEESYVDPGICDGHQWGMIIYFADGEKMESHGSNAYPETWDDMNAAFSELTGENILIYKSDWLD